MYRLASVELLSGMYVLMFYMFQCILYLDYRSNFLNKQLVHITQILELFYHNT